MYTAFSKLAESKLCLAFEMEDGLAWEFIRVVQAGLGILSEFDYISRRLISHF
jgi:hypothetical protein